MFLWRMNKIAEGLLWLFVIALIVVLIAAQSSVGSTEEAAEEAGIEEIISEEIAGASVGVEERDLSGQPESETSETGQLGADPKGDGTAIALLIPHAAIAGGVIIGLGVLWLIFRWRELLHKERLAAIEKSLPWLQSSRQRLIFWGFIWGGLGIAAGAALWANFGWVHALWGLMPLILGLVLVLYAVLEREASPGAPAAIPSTPGNR